MGASLSFPNPIEAALALLKDDEHDKRDKLAQLKTQRDAVVQRQQTRLDALSKDLAKLCQQMEELKKKDYKTFREEEEHVFIVFAGLICKRVCNAEDCKEMMKLERCVNVAFVGKVSSGKSTFVNAFFGERVAKTGAGRTTTEPHMHGVVETQPNKVRMQLWDVQGDDAGYDYLDADKVRFLNTMDIVVVVYDSTPYDARRLACVARSLGKVVLFCRNKLDYLLEEGMVWQDEVARDRALLKELGLDPVQLFGVAARQTLRAMVVLREALAAAGAAAAAAEVSAKLPNIELYEWIDFSKCLQGSAEALMAAAK